MAGRAPRGDGGPEEHEPGSWPLGRLLGAASRAVERAWYEALEARGLTHAGLIVLHFVELGFSSQTDLARVAQVEAQTMSRTVDRLEREEKELRELISDFDPTDRLSRDEVHDSPGAMSSTRKI